MKKVDFYKMAIKLWKPALLLLVALTIMLPNIEVYARGEQTAPAGPSAVSVDSTMAGTAALVTREANAQGKDDTKPPPAPTPPPPPPSKSGSGSGSGASSQPPSGSGSGSGPGASSQPPSSSGGGSGSGSSSGVSSQPPSGSGSGSSSGVTTPPASGILPDSTASSSSTPASQPTATSAATSSATAPTTTSTASSLAAPKLISPARGKKLDRNEVRFQWQAPQISGATFNIVVFDKDTQSSIQEASGIRGSEITFPLFDDTYGWRVWATDSAGNSGPPSETWWLQVVDEANAPPEITVTSPNGGESITGGTVYAITWAAVDDLTSIPELRISISFSLNAGESWETIAENLANNGAFAWKVPAGINTDKALIKVTGSDKSGSGGSGGSSGQSGGGKVGLDVSDSMFTISQ